MIKKVHLSSGNTFYYLKDSAFIESAFVVSKDNEFLGGFIGKEAERKFKAFSSMQQNAVDANYSLSGAKDSELFFYTLRLTKKEKFAEKLGAASRLFLNNFGVVFNDRQDCDGTSSKAESCDDREHYYNTVGCDKLYKSGVKAMLGLFIANHLAVFSAEHFRYTFFQKKELAPDTDLVVDFGTRYGHGFKAPAYYVKALCA